MNKSIYEEALEIMIDNILPREGGKVNKTKVIKALLQAQKQEKLLELYRELTKLYEELYTIGLSQLALYQIEIYEIKQQIKELENEKNT